MNYSTCTKKTNLRDVAQNAEASTMFIIIIINNTYLSITSFLKKLEESIKMQKKL